MRDNDARDFYKYWSGTDKRVRVTAGDYACSGSLVAIFTKKSGAVRCVVEDDCGRLFIHNTAQLEIEEHP